eukprot:CAMPEP_0173437404 /NCGR_PEP_ID=MMETSP1357-20121228/18006_1 /TAXON_ID=77926 /ORGANISM="Hemiselmis rufescens, Strain PCC563" /LENGTH=431 /DNA_ID=CAMNT_0014402583 /DNA_START=186 /DNA_END=1478 /DNA_ORIENTATION=-
MPTSRLLPLLLALPLAASLSLRSPFKQLSDGSLEDWSVAGSTVATESYLRLTPAEAGHEGSIWSKSAMPYNEWEIEIQFKVTGARYLGGDGFVLWLTEEREKFGATFGNQEDFKGIGIVFDTYDNDGRRDNPSIMAVSSDGSLRFDHDTDGGSSRLVNAMCKVNFRNPRTPVQVRVRYQSGGLTVAFDTRGQKSYQDCFSVNAEGIHMPSKYYVGMTAHTGQVADNHDIYSLSVTDLTPEDQRPPPAAPTEASSPTPKSDAGDDTTHTPQSGAEGPGADEEEEEHRWKSDDDRHLVRYQEAVTKWSAASHKERQRLHSERERLHREGRHHDSDVEEEEDADDTSEDLMAHDHDDEPDDPIPSSPAPRSNKQRPASAKASTSGGGIDPEVAGTLAKIQEEVKAIAHEMRGTITLAHAVTSQAQQGNGGTAAG